MFSSIFAENFNMINKSQLNSLINYRSQYIIHVKVYDGI